MVPLAGSERTEIPEWTREARPLDPAADVEVTLVLRRRAELPAPATGPAVAPDDLGARHGADPDDLARVVRDVGELGGRVVWARPAERLVRVGGRADVLSAMFGTALSEVHRPVPDGEPIAHRYRTGGLSVPAEWDGLVTAVLGLDDRPQARTRIVRPHAVTTSYTPPQLGQVYRFPPNTDGTGQTIAIIELGGGYDPADLSAYFTRIGVRPPAVSAVGVDGAANTPGRDQGSDGEVALDVEVAGGLAPGARIVVYFAPNNDAGFVDAVSRAAHAAPTPAAISISWGGPEDSWTAQARTALDQAIADAATLGVTVTVAAGDDGSTDQGDDGRAHVDFPASSPHALACGGTRLIADPTSGVVTEETVWHNAGGGATGGGVSRVFALPTWQAGAGVPAPADAGAGGHPGRGVPDVAAVADPQTGYQVRVGGRDGVIGGTSAVAPLWAALVARLAQATGKPLGLVQPALYGRPGTGFRDIVDGDNGAYRAGDGWDPCTGLGVPVGTDLLTGLSAPPPQV